MGSYINYCISMLSLISYLTHKILVFIKKLSDIYGICVYSVDLRIGCKLPGQLLLLKNLTKQTLWLYIKLDLIQL